jgi:hypothetical protein
MYQRIGRWSSMGFIHSIARVDDNTVRIACSEHHTGGRVDMLYSSQRDRPLIMFMLQMGKTIQSILANYRFAGSAGSSATSQPTVTIDRLLSTFRGIMNDPTSGSQLKMLYTEETCVEFHHFLVATLLSYSNALQTLHNLAPSGGGEAAETVLHLSNLVWKISDSKILEIHLQAISGVLNEPSACAQNSYADFVGGEILAEEDGGEDDNPPAPGSQGVGSLCRSWIRLQASHFEALHVLDSYCRGRGRNRSPPPTGINIDISLIAVRAPPLEIEDWEKTVDRLATLPILHDTHNFDLRAAKSYVCRRKKEKATIHKNSQPRVSVPHCEACLGVLIKLSRMLADRNSMPDALTKLLQV